MLNIVYDAGSLYDGGWRKDDKELLMVTYDMSEEMAERVCKELEELEESQQ